MQKSHVSEIKKIGEKIRTLRVANRLTQIELADACEVERITIYRIEKGIFAPSLHVLFSIAKTLNVDIIELFK